MKKKLFFDYFWMFTNIDRKKNIDGEYFVLETLIYDSIEYGFANKIDENDEPLNIYKLVYNENGINKVLEDEKTANILLPLFEEILTKEIKEGEY